MKRRYNLIIRPATPTNMARHFFIMPFNYNHTTKDCLGCCPMFGAHVMALSESGQGHIFRTPGRWTLNKKLKEHYAKQWRAVRDSMRLVWWSYLPSVQPPRSESKKYWSVEELPHYTKWTVHKSATRRVKHEYV